MVFLIHKSTTKMAVEFACIYVFFYCLIAQDAFGFSLPRTSVLSNFEGLSYPTNFLQTEHRRVRRSASGFHPYSQPIKLPIFAFGYNFTLVLLPDNQIISQRASLVVGGRESPGGLASVANHMVKGFVQGHEDSMVFGSVIDGVFRGTISLKTSDYVSSQHADPPYGTFYIEPSGNFFNFETGFHSLIYHATHTRSPNEGKRMKRDTHSSNDFGFCGLSNPIISKKLSSLRPHSGGRNRRLPRASVSGNVNLHSSPHVALFHQDLLHGAGQLESLNLSASQTQTVSGGSKGTPLHHKFSGPSTRVCNLYLQSDSFLWDRVMKMQHVQGNRELAVKEITSIFTQHVQGAQVIYQFTVFRDHSGRLEFPGVSFRVDRVLINVTEEDCKFRRHSNYDLYDHSYHLPSPTALPHGVLSPLTIQQINGTTNPSSGTYADENPFCAPNIDITNYLNLHSYNKHDDFCLAYVFTYRDFSGGTLGLAWVAEPSGSGGVCEKHRQMREGSHNVYKSLNTGVVTLLNYGSQVALKVSQLTFAHEMGHNFGAKHDDDHKDEPYGCMPPVDDPRGNYIMFASATSGDKDNNNKFSTCSSDSIARLLDRVLSDDNNCFLSSDGPFCGNQLTEEGEQCDCGFTKESCRDKCCHPKSSSTPCMLTDSIMVHNTSQKVQCSPTAGGCCTENCQYRPKTHLCQASGECHKASYCNGEVAKCPAPELMPDGTPCQDHTRVCKQGQCLGSICERIPGWQECSLTRDAKVTPELMCFVACKENRSGSPCISTFQLETDVVAREKYPQLVGELLRNGKGTRLSPGTPCDNYRGYCDVFLRCRSVDAEGPLARLRNLLFSPQMLQKLKTWVTIHWWAVILICLSTIIAMIVFVKLCAVNTPSARINNSASSRALAIQTLSPFIDPEPMPPRPGEQSYVWALTPHPVGWIAPGPVHPNYQTPQSPWAWPRRKKPKPGKPSRRHHRRRASSNPPLRTKRQVPSAPIDPMDFPPPNARQKPLPESKLLIPAKMKLVQRELQGLVESDRVVPRASGSCALPTEIPLQSQSPSSKFRLVQGVPLRPHASRLPNIDESRPTSLFIRRFSTHSENPTNGAVRQPKIPSKLTRPDSRTKSRPLSCVERNDLIPSTSHLSSQPHRIVLEVSPANPNIASKPRFNKQELISNIPPPAYDELLILEQSSHEP